jgi:integrase
MSAMKVSEFMLNLSKELVEKKQVAESTASAYVKSLYILNGKAAFKTLTFLKDTETIEKKLASYADNTQKALYTTITSVLSLYKDKPTYKKAYAYYYEKMMGKAKDMKETGADTSEKTTKEKENWIDWKEVQSKHKGLGDEVDKFVQQKLITPEQFSTLLHWVILSLYTEIQPRRNQDYLDMYVVKKWNENMSKDKNYLDLATQHFVFNKYKTQKTYGQQKLPIPEGLMRVIQLYLKHHPLVKGNKTKTTEYRFLVSPDGTPLTAVNAITRILNRIFGKKIGSSMLRHIFLSSKYDIKEMENDAEAMGHSVSEQKNYMRGSGDMVELVIPMLEG